MELFYYDLSTGQFAQVSDTTGGIGSTPGGCPSYRPHVSRDSGVIVFLFPRFSTETCNLDGPQRNAQDGFLFRFVCAVSKRPGNRGPVFEPPPPQEVVAGRTLSFTLTASDPEADPSSFVAQVKDGTDVPPGSQITDHHDGTATFRWPTRPEDVATYTLRVAAFDEGGGEIFHDISISVVPHVDQAPSPTPTPPSPLVCTGDCNSNGTVNVAELVTGVSIALGTQPASVCGAFDCHNAVATPGLRTPEPPVAVDCLIRAVNNALSGCPSTAGVASFTPT
jgi:hypothetical protein